MKRIPLVARLLLIAVLCCLTELVYFNGLSLFDKIFQRNDVIVRTLGEAEQRNWIETDDALISEYDPVLVFSGIDQYVGNITLHADTDRDVPYVQLFFPDAAGSYQLNDIRTYKGDVRTGLMMPVFKEVTSLRVDLSDDPGLLLRNLTLSYDRHPFSFSLSRVMVLFLLYWLVTGLFSLQKQQNYDEILQDNASVPTNP